MARISSTSLRRELLAGAAAGAASEAEDSRHGGCRAQEA